MPKILSRTEMIIKQELRIRDTDYTINSCYRAIEILKKAGTSVIPQLVLKKEIDIQEQLMVAHQRELERLKGK